MSALISDTNASEAIARAEAGADQAWKAEFIEAAIFALTQNRVITMDDVWELAPRPESGDSRAAGGLMRILARAGYATPATACPHCNMEFGERIALSKDSEDERGHSRNLKMWASRIFNPNVCAATWERLTREVVEAL